MSPLTESQLRGACYITIVTNASSIIGTAEESFAGNVQISSPLYHTRVSTLISAFAETVTINSMDS